MSGSLRVWQRGLVQGVTLHFRHAGRELGDIVLNWNAEDPSFLVTDLGSGLERLRWTITRSCWSEVVYGRWTAAVDPAGLDALRTTVLLLACGVTPASRGPGSAIRRLLRVIPPDWAIFGLSAYARTACAYWNLTAPVTRTWSEVTTRLERELSPGSSADVEPAREQLRRATADSRFTVDRSPPHLACRAAPPQCG